MSPIDRLRWATQPVQGRATVLASALLYLAMISGWIVAGCGMVGYMRWFFRQSAAEARKH